MGSERYNRMKIEINIDLGEEIKYVVLQLVDMGEKRVVDIGDLIGEIGEENMVKLKYKILKMNSEMRVG